MLFPQRLPKEYTDAKGESEKVQLKETKPTGNEFLPALKRLLTNKLYVTNFFSTIFYMFALMGLFTFIPKYIEYQFRQKASRSSGCAHTK